MRGQYTYAALLHLNDRAFQILCIDKRNPENAPHRGPGHLRIVEIGTALTEQDARCAGRLRCTQNGSEIPRILQVLKDDNQRSAGTSCCQYILKLIPKLLHQSKNPLRGLCIGKIPEDRIRNHLHLTGGSFKHFSDRLSLSGLKE